MIRMAVRAILAEGDDDVGLEIPHDVSDRADEDVEVGRLEPAVHVIVANDVLDAEDRARRSQLPFPD